MTLVTTPPSMRGTVDASQVVAWRHPRPRGVAGRCIGRTDVAVDPRKARRLARRIHRASLVVAAEGARTVCCSPLRRCRDVARHLRRLGWRVVVDAALLEADFGRWDGLPWDHVPRDEIDAWVADFSGYAPGGGESLRQVLTRAAAWVPPAGSVTVVAHAGWMLARRWWRDHGSLSNADDGACPRADQWPAPPPYGACWTGL